MVFHFKIVVCFPTTHCKPPSFIVYPSSEYLSFSQVLDARDPQGTRCYHLERHLKEHCKHKHVVLLLNKVSPHL